MSRKSKERILGTLRELAFHKKSQITIQDLALRLNPKIRGWINYYGKSEQKEFKSSVLPSSPPNHQMDIEQI
jgi:RNA-directed DNA polymerase